MEYTITPRVPNVRPADDPDYDGITFVYVFTEVLVPWTQPPVNGQVTLAVANAQGFLAGMTVVLEGAGYYEVVSTTALDRMTVMNFGTNYNQPPGTGIAPGKVTTTSLPGPPGGTGPQGPQGAQGVQGPVGPPLSVKGTVANPAALPSSGNTVNDLWVSLSDGHAYAWTGSWIDLGPFQGPRGFMGPVGPAGPQGSQGPTGATGPQGNQGPSGSAGTTGATGPQGPQGVPGSQGPTGPQGPAGTGLNMKGTVPTSASLPATGNQPNDTYTAIDTGHAWTWNGTTWIDIGLIQGPAGPTGPTGPTGNPGTAGATGTAATVTVGTTTTGVAGSNAAVTNSGSPSAAVFNFTVPQGIQGVAGAAGSQGPAGPQGNQGVTGNPGPTGSQGPQGPQGLTGPTGPAPITVTTGASFTVPSPGATVTVNVADASWIVVGQMVYVDQAGGGVGQAGALQVTAKTGNQLTLLNPVPPSIPLADATQNGLLRQLSGNTTDFVDGTNACQSLAPAIDPEIWSVRLRSLNALANSTFEVDQAVTSNVAIVGNVRTCDRWMSRKPVSTLAATGTQINSNILVPGTNFRLTQNGLRITLTTQQASLAAADGLQINQNIEGPVLRELISDVFSVQMCVRCSVAPIKFGLALRDGAATRSLTKLATLTPVNTPTWLQFPNLPAWSSGGTFVLTPGNIGAVLSICLATGSTNMSPANDTWQTGNFWGAVGQDNFGSLAVNTFFDIYFIQLEPGPVCSPPMDKPFFQNYEETLRYYQKTYDYGTAVGAVTPLGLRNLISIPASTLAYGPVSFHKPMAKTPTVTLYDGANGAAGSVQDGAGTHHTGAAAANIGTTGFPNITFTTATASAMSVATHYVADTGW